MRETPGSNGGRLQVGNPGNRGGGRTPDAVRARLLDVLDRRGVSYIDQVLSGEVTYVLTGICEHCGKESTGPGRDGILKIAPSVDNQLRAVEIAASRSLPSKTEATTVVSPDVVGRLERQLDMILSQPTWDREELLARLDGIWRQ